MSASTVRIGLIFPDLLGTYGDRGNAAILASRLDRRGIPVEIVTVLAEDPVPGDLDCYVIGGGEDHAQRAAAERLTRSPLALAWSRGASIVAVCAGFQLLGTSLDLGDGEILGGLGILDAVTVRGARRRVGDIILDASDPAIGAISGFENHRGVTEVHDDVPALGRSQREGDREGVLLDRLVATYLHGPVLVRNPALADRVLSWTVGRLAPLEADFADALHGNLVDRFKQRSTPWRMRRRAARG